jgi:hypothetical protein
MPGSRMRPQPSGPDEPAPPRPAWSAVLPGTSVRSGRPPRMAPSQRRRGEEDLPDEPLDPALLGFCLSSHMTRAPTTSRSSTVIRSETSTATGRLRMPEITIPVATYTGLFVPGPDGTDAIRPFGRSLPRRLYPTHDDYVSRFRSRRRPARGRRLPPRRGRPHPRRTSERTGRPLTRPGTRLFAGMRRSRLQLAPAFPRRPSHRATRISP